MVDVLWFRQQQANHTDENDDCAVRTGISNRTSSDGFNSTEPARAICGCSRPRAVCPDLLSTVFVQRARRQAKHLRLLRAAQADTCSSQCRGCSVADTTAAASARLHFPIECLCAQRGLQTRCCW